VFATSLFETHLFCKRDGLGVCCLRLTLYITRYQLISIKIIYKWKIYPRENLQPLIHQLIVPRRSSIPLEQKVSGRWDGTAAAKTFITDPITLKVRTDTIKVLIVITTRAALSWVKLKTLIGKMSK